MSSRYLIFRKRKGQMANESSVHLFPPEIIFFLTGSVDHMIGIPINCWALWLIVSGKRSLIESELLTLNLLTMEIACSMCFFLSLIHLLCKVSSLGPLTGFYRGMAVVGRALFQCHVCVDRYLAVVHPMVFIRYKQLRYRGTCLAAVWLVVICSGLTNVFLPSSHNMLFICSAAHLAPALFIELFCSLSIVRILRRPSPGSKEAQGKKEGNQQKKRAVKIICMVLVMLVFNMLPFTVLPLTSVSPVVWLPIAFTFSTVGSSAQAFLFLSRAGELPCKR